MGQGPLSSQYRRFYPCPSSLIVCLSCGSPLSFVSNFGARREVVKALEPWPCHSPSPPFRKWEGLEVCGVTGAGSARATPHASLGIAWSAPGWPGPSCFRSLPYRAEGEEGTLSGGLSCQFQRGTGEEASQLQQGQICFSQLLWLLVPLPILSSEPLPEWPSGEG